ncbi:hypothetical protein BEQ56_03700 [Anaerolineaceae bacterium oral taxon 439]|nr:hypothetical protein BEQ56_03700 [Anaerolineaceae bacterium oral taxon 439]
MTAALITKAWDTEKKVCKFKWCLFPADAASFSGSRTKDFALSGRLYPSTGRRLERMTAAGYSAPADAPEADPGFQGHVSLYKPNLTDRRKGLYCL